MFTIPLHNLIKEENNSDFRIFSFDYNFYNEELKEDFEEKFKLHFYNEEIGFETIALFKQYLRSELNRIYPYYQHLYKTSIQTYSMLDNYLLEETILRNTENNGNTNNDSTDYDTPRSNLTSPSFKSSSSNNVTTKGKEESTRVTKGNIGVQTSQDLIKKEREIIINIDDLILQELSKLFMEVYNI